MLELFESALDLFLVARQQCRCGEQRVCLAGLDLEGSLSLTVGRVMILEIEILARLE